MSNNPGVGPSVSDLPFPSPVSDHQRIANALWLLDNNPTGLAILPSQPDEADALHFDAVASGASDSAMTGRIMAELEPYEQIAQRPAGRAPSSSGATRPDPKFEDFFNRHFDAVLKEAAKFGVDPALMLGLAAHESNWGTSNQAINMNNPFGHTPDGRNPTSFPSLQAAWQVWAQPTGLESKIAAATPKRLSIGFCRTIEAYMAQRSVVTASEHIMIQNSATVVGGQKYWASSSRFGIDCRDGKLKEICFLEGRNEKVKRGGRVSDLPDEALMRLFISLPAAGFVGALFALGIGMAEAKQPACSRDDIARAASAATSARAILLSAPIGPELGPSVPAEAQQAIAVLKDRIGDLVAAYMRCAGAVPSARAIERDLSALATTTALDRGADRPQGAIQASPYGDGLTFEARRSIAGHGFVSIVARFQIPCGQDAVLSILQPVDGVWTETLRWQSKRYDEISGAFMAFDYAVLPPDRSGAWFVATKYVTPWCTSSWRGIRYAILQPAADGGAPAEVLSDSDGIYIGDNDFGRLTASQNGFTLQFHGASIDPEIHNRVWIRRFRRAGGASFVRVPPIAQAPVDFVDEWIVSPWGAAQSWSLPPEAQGLKVIHDRLHERQRGEPFAVLSLQRCRGGDVRHQVGVQANGLETFYFLVSGTKSYMLRAVSAAPDPACTGANLLREPYPSPSP